MPGPSSGSSGAPFARPKSGMLDIISFGNSWRPPGQPGSGGRTITPPSSIQLTFGMLTTPNNASSWCVGSRSDGCVGRPDGCAASM
jgi:hypothetical protein